MMSRRVWKYDLPPAPKQVHLMPRGAKALCVQAQDGIGRLWAEIPDAEAPKEERIFYTFGTGHAIQSDLILRYVGTYQMLNGDLVWHVYEEATT